MTTVSCPNWAQDCADCGDPIPAGVYRQYVDDVSLSVRHINGCNTKQAQQIRERLRAADGQAQ